MIRYHEFLLKRYTFLLLLVVVVLIHVCNTYDHDERVCSILNPFNAHANHVIEYHMTENVANSNATRHENTVRYDSPDVSGASGVSAVPSDLIAAGHSEKISVGLGLVGSHPIM